MNQMTPSEFHDRLDDAMPDAVADGALPAAIEDDINAGRRMLRRRRGTAALGAVAAVAFVASGVGLAPRFGDAPSTNGLDAASSSNGMGVGSPSSETELLDACRNGETSNAGREAIFGSGVPTVKALARSESKIVLAVESADGTSWGECFVHLGDSEFQSGMTVYDATEQTRDFIWNAGLAGCDEQGQCSKFSVSVVDRRSPLVAAVEFLTADGKTTRVDTVDGYYAFNYVGPLPGGTQLDIDDYDAVKPPGRGEIQPVMQPLKRITFLDAAGTPIAAEAQDGSGLGEDGERIAGLPSITEFPSLRSGQGF